MKNPQQTKTSSHLLLNLSMIVLETFYSFVFDHDDMVKEHARPFLEKKTIIKVNSYIPYINFYIKFTDKGILFDLEKPQEKIDIEMSSQILGYAQAFLLGHKQSIRAIKIYGTHQEKDQLRDLLTQLAVPHLISDWKKWLFTHKSQDITASKSRVQPLINKIDLQRSKINSLQVEVKQYKNRVRKIQHQQKLLNIGFITIIFILFGLLLYNYWIH